MDNNASVWRAVMMGEFTHDPADSIITWRSDVGPSRDSAGYTDMLVFWRGRSAGCSFPWGPGETSSRRIESKLGEWVDEAGHALGYQGPVIQNPTCIVSIPRYLDVQKSSQSRPEDHPSDPGHSRLLSDDTLLLVPYPDDRSVPSRTPWWRRAWARIYPTLFGESR